MCGIDPMSLIRHSKWAKIIAQTVTLVSLINVQDGINVQVGKNIQICEILET